MTRFLECRCLKTPHLRATPKTKNALLDSIKNSSTYIHRNTKKTTGMKSSLVYVQRVILSGCSRGEVLEWFEGSGLVLCSAPTVDWRRGELEITSFFICKSFCNVVQLRRREPLLTCDKVHSSSDPPVHEGRSRILDRISSFSSWTPRFEEQLNCRTKVLQHGRMTKNSPVIQMEQLSLLACLLCWRWWSFERRIRAVLEMQRSKKP